MVGLGVTLLAEWIGYLRPERWMSSAVLIATTACAGIAAGSSIHHSARRGVMTNWLRPVWRLHAALGLVVFVVLTYRIEFLALAVGLVFLPWLRPWTWVGVLAWTASLFWGGLWGIIGPKADILENPLGAVAAQSGPDAEGLVGIYRDRIITPWGQISRCPWGHSWLITASTEGRIRPLAGLYRETNPSAEFIEMESLLGSSASTKYYPQRPDWYEVWQNNGFPGWGGPSAAEALGGRWYSRCDENGNISLTELSGVMASGVTVVARSSEDAWHRAAARWWIPISAGVRVEPESWEPVPIQAKDNRDLPASQAATGVWLRAYGDRLTVGAETAGWAWLRVPWDPFWRGPPGTVMHKGGPGHLVVWVSEGETDLKWRVPAWVDAAAAVVTGAAGLTVLVMAVGNRRRSDDLDPDRPHPIRTAVGLYADTVDVWLRTVGRWTRSSGRASSTDAARGPHPPPGPTPIAENRPKR